MLISSKSKLIRKMIMVKHIMSPFLVPGCFSFQKGEFNRFRALSSSILGSSHLLAVRLATVCCTCSLESHEDCKVIFCEVPDRKIKMSCIQHCKSSNYYLSTHVEPSVTVSLNPAVNNYEEI